MSILSENFGNDVVARVSKRAKRIDALVQNIIDTDWRVVTSHGDLSISTVTMNFNYRFWYNGLVISRTFSHTIKIQPKDRISGLDKYIRESLNQIIETTYRSQGNRNIIPGSIVPQPSVSVKYDKYHSDSLRYYTTLREEMAKKH